MQFCQTTYVRDLPYTGMANGFPGRHIFRIDEKILPGVCIRLDWNFLDKTQKVIIQGPDRGEPAAGVCPGEREHAGRDHGQPHRALL